MFVNANYMLLGANSSSGRLKEGHAKRAATTVYLAGNPEAARPEPTLRNVSPRRKPASK